MLACDFQKPFQLVIASTWMCRTIAITETRGSSSFYENSMATYSDSGTEMLLQSTRWLGPVCACPPIIEESKPAAMSGSSGLSPMMFSFFHFFFREAVSSFFAFIFRPPLLFFLSFAFFFHSLRFVCCLPDYFFSFCLLFARLFLSIRFQLMYLGWVWFFLFFFQPN